MIRPSPPPWWPAEASSRFDDLVAYRLVGASVCADHITNALVEIAHESEQRGRDISADLLDAGAAMIALKPDTALYRNVITTLTNAAINGRAADVKTVARQLDDHRRDARISVVNRTQAVLEASHTLLVHDYSSTVERVLRGLGATRARRIVVTSGEPLCQGPNVASIAAAAGHTVTYTPDMSVARVIDEVDAYVTGVESFYLDGSLSNTVGTLMLALLCREKGVPVVAPAETLKCDRERASAADAPLTSLLLRPWPDNNAPPGVDDNNVVRFVLDAVPAALITTYVTETDVCDSKICRRGSTSSS